MYKKSMQVKVKMLTCCLIGAVVFGGSPVVANAAVTAGAANFTSMATTTPARKGYLTSGVTLSLAQCLSTKTSTKTQIEENDVPVVKSEFADIGVSNVEEDSYVNIRSAANVDSEVVGKLYSNSAVTVLGTEGEWYQIHSGNCEGYVKSEFIITGDEELAKSICTRVAISQVDALNIRKDMSLEADVINQASQGETLYVIEELEGWVKIAKGNTEGYVSSDYVKCENHFKVAESKEEEAARLKKEEEQRKKEEEKRRREEERKAAQAANNSGSANSKPNKTYNPPTGGNGQAVVDYACQFIGNPYVYGGTSLTNGADCSGFVMSVYAQFGVSLPHSSYSLRSVGYEVSKSEMQPGDIVCYSGHVAIYVGGNTIVHASNRKDGIKYTSPADYTRIITVRRIF